MTLGEIFQRLKQGARSLGTAQNPSHAPLSISQRLGIAVFLVLAALAIALILREWLAFPYWFPFLVAGITSAWIGGRVSGWAGVVLSTLVCDFFFDRPYYSLAVDPEELPEFIAFALAMLAGNWFGNWRKNADAYLRQTRDELASRVRDGGIELQKINEALRTEVTSREQAEQERRIAELQWQAVFNNATMGVVLTDEDGYILSSNARFGELVIASASDLRGCRLSDYLPPAKNRIFLAQLQQLRSGDRERIELEVLPPEDRMERVPMSMIVTAIPASTDFSGFMIALCEDISERRRAAEALLATRAELAHSSRLTMIGELTASIAHELNQPLSAVVTNTNACLHWLAAERPNLQEARNTMGWIMRDAKRASDVVSRIRTLIRREAPRREFLDFRDVIRESLDLIQHELELKKMDVSTELGPVLPKIFGDRIQLQQAYLNLVINALEAMETVDDRPRRLTIRCKPASSARGIEVDVCDNGPGVPATDLFRLSTAFYTTKATGTGLGLWISSSIIENHGGILVPLRNDGHGMTFRFYLPIESPASDSTESIAGEDFTTLSRQGMRE